MDSKCTIFEDNETNKFAYTEIHNEFKKLFEKLFAEMIQNLGITEEIVFKACETAYNSPETRSFVESIVSVGDFLYFKKLMIERNKILHGQAIK